MPTMLIDRAMQDVQRPDLIRIFDGSSLLLSGWKICPTWSSLWHYGAIVCMLHAVEMNLGDREILFYFLDRFILFGSNQEVTPNRTFNNFWHSLQHLFCHTIWTTEKMINDADQKNGSLLYLFRRVFLYS